MNCLSGSRDGSAHPREGRWLINGDGDLDSGENINDNPAAGSRVLVGGRVKVRKGVLVLVLSSVGLPDYWDERVNMHMGDDLEAREKKRKKIGTRPEPDKHSDRLLLTDRPIDRRRCEEEVDCEGEYS